MTSRTWRRVVAALSLVLALVTVGCKVVTSPQASGALHVAVEIDRYLEGNTHVSVRFSDQANNTVEFVSGETVACDGQFLRYALGYYVGDVPRQPATGSYAITYTPAGGSATPATSGPITFKVAVVADDVSIIQPASGATVLIPSSSPLTITYQPSTLSDTSVYATATDSRLHITAVLPQPDGGTLSMPAENFSEFQAGPGAITLARQTSSTIGGTAFAVIEVTFKNLTVESIQWQ